MFKLYQYAALYAMCLIAVSVYTQTRVVNSHFPGLASAYTNFRYTSVNIEEKVLLVQCYLSSFLAIVTS